MRTLSDYMKDHYQNTKFQILNWSSDSDTFNIIADGKKITYRFKGIEDQQEIINRIQSYWNASRSVWKTLKYMAKYVDKVPTANYTLDKEHKMVKCDNCGYEAPIDYNQPGTTCPNCGEGQFQLK